jgi:hypothetical protein
MPTLITHQSQDLKVQAWMKVNMMLPIQTVTLMVVDVCGHMCEHAESGWAMTMAMSSL